MTMSIHWLPPMKDTHVNTLTSTLLVPYSQDKLDKLFIIRGKVRDTENTYNLISLRHPE